MLREGRDAFGDGVSSNIGSSRCICAHMQTAANRKYAGEVKAVKKINFKAEK